MLAIPTAMPAAAAAPGPGHAVQLRCFLACKTAGTQTIKGPHISALAWRMTAKHSLKVHKSHSGQPPWRATRCASMQAAIGEVSELTSCNIPGKVQAGSQQQLWRCSGEAITVDTAADGN